MRYNSESLEIKNVISGNILLLEDIKISLGLFTTVQEKHALFLVTYNLDLPTTAKNRIRVAVIETKISKKSLYLVRA